MIRKTKGTGTSATLPQSSITPSNVSCFSPTHPVTVATHKGKAIAVIPPGGSQIFVPCRVNLDHAYYVAGKKCPECSWVERLLNWFFWRRK